MDKEPYKRSRFIVWVALKMRANSSLSSESTDNLTPATSHHIFWHISPIGFRCVTSSPLSHLAVLLWESQCRWLSWAVGAQLHRNIRPIELVGPQHRYCSPWVMPCIMVITIRWWDSTALRTPQDARCGILHVAVWYMPFESIYYYVHVKALEADDCRCVNLSTYAPPQFCLRAL